MTIWRTGCFESADILAGIENQEFTRLEAGADPENVGSVRVLEKAGFQRGELVRDFHVRAVNEGGGKMSNMQFFYLERPGK